MKAFAYDVAAIVVFVLLGRRSHDEDGSFITGTLRVAAPFLIALAVGWLATRAWRSPKELNTGIQLWLVTIVLGMLLRRFVFDDGTATAFIIVASVFTGLLLIGWRAVAEHLAERRAEGAERP